MQPQGAPKAFSTSNRHSHHSHPNPTILHLPTLHQSASCACAKEGSRTYFNSCTEISSHFWVLLFLRQQWPIIIDAISFLSKKSDRQCLRYLRLPKISHVEYQDRLWRLHWSIMCNTWPITKCRQMSCLHERDRNFDQLQQSRVINKTCSNVVQT